MPEANHPPDSAKVPPALLLADHYAEPPGYRIQRPQGLKDWFVTFTNAGQGRYLWGSKEYICSRGDLVVLPPGLPHDYGTALTDKPWEHYWVHFNSQPILLRWLLIPETNLEPYICHISDSVSETRVVEDFERLLTAYRGAQPLIAQEQLQDVLLIAAQHYAKAIAEGADERIVVIVQNLFQRLNESIEVPVLADLVAMSPSRLAHLFKEQMHEPIMHMLLKLRLRYAARLLRFTALSIGEISAETGFQSQFYFSRRFKAYFRVSPKIYRQQFTLPRIDSTAF